MYQTQYFETDKLNEAERQIMRTHTTVGAELLSKQYPSYAEAVRLQHQRMVGRSGIPATVPQFLCLGITALVTSLMR